MFLRYIVLVGCLIFSSAQCSALAHKKIAQHGSWTVAEVPKNAIYVLASPERSQGKYSKRGRVYAMITFWHKGDTSIHFEQGYMIKKNSPVMISILDKKKKPIKKYKFFPHKEELWAPASLDKEVLSWMRKGYYMIVDSVSSRGTKTKDTYNLSGVSKSLTAGSNRQIKKTSPNTKVVKKKASISSKKSMASKVSTKKSDSFTKKTSIKRPASSKPRTKAKRAMVINRPALKK